MKKLPILFILLVCSVVYGDSAFLAAVQARLASLRASIASRSCPTYYADCLTGTDVGGQMCDNTVCASLTFSALEGQANCVQATRCPPVTSGTEFYAACNSCRTAPNTAACYTNTVARADVTHLGGVNSCTGIQQDAENPPAWVCQCTPTGCDDLDIAGNCEVQPITADQFRTRCQNCFTSCGGDESCKNTCMDTVDTSGSIANPNGATCRGSVGPVNSWACGCNAANADCSTVTNAPDCVVPQITATQFRQNCQDCFTSCGGDQSCKDTCMDTADTVGSFSNPPGAQCRANTGSPGFWACGCNSSNADCSSPTNPPDCAVQITTGTDFYNACSSCGFFDFGCWAAAEALAAPGHNASCQNFGGSPGDWSCGCFFGCSPPQPGNCEVAYTTGAQFWAACDACNSSSPGGLLACYSGVESLASNPGFANSCTTSGGSPNDWACNCTTTGEGDCSAPPQVNDCTVPI